MSFSHDPYSFGPGVPHDLVCKWYAHMAEEEARNRPQLPEHPPVYGLECGSVPFAAFAPQNHAPEGRPVDEHVPHIRPSELTPKQVQEMLLFCVEHEE